MQGELMKAGGCQKPLRERTSKADHGWSPSAQRDFSAAKPPPRHLHLTQDSHLNVSGWF